LKPFDDIEKGKLSKSQIKTIRANKLAIARANKERVAKNKPLIDNTDSTANEIETIDTSMGAATDGTTTTTLSAVPAQVDNSTLNAFPPVGNQGSLGSCVAFATTYYTMSHQVCLALGCDNKNLREKIFSPKWTYNLINGGQNNGSYFSDAFGVMNSHGAPFNSEFPYDGNYLAWSMNSSNWKNAINYRMTNYSYSSVNTDAGIANAKQLLANGNVLVIGVYISSWVYGRIRSLLGAAGLSK